MFSPQNDSNKENIDPNSSTPKRKLVSLFNSPQTPPTNLLSTFNEVLSPQNQTPPPKSNNFLSNLNKVLSPHTPNNLLSKVTSSSPIQSLTDLDSPTSSPFQISRRSSEESNSKKQKSDIKRPDIIKPYIKEPEKLNETYKLNQNINDVYNINSNKNAGINKAFVYLNVTKKDDLQNKEYVVKEFSKGNYDAFVKEVNNLTNLRIECNKKNNCDYFVNIVNYTQNPNYIIFEKAGTSFDKLSNISIDDIKLYRKQLLDAINALYEMNIFHGDIKPQNIVIDNNKKLRLIDFGEASLLSEIITRWPNIENYDNYNYDEKTGKIYFAGFNSLSPETKEIKKDVEIYIANAIMDQKLEKIAKEKYIKYKLKYLKLKEEL